MQSTTETETETKTETKTKTKIKTLFLSSILLYFLIPEANASGFGLIGNWVLKPLALSSCASHLKPYVSKAKERALCGCAWHYIVSTKGESTFVLKQVMQHSKSVKWQAVEKRQISDCVAATDETKTLTAAEGRNIKLAKWMSVSER